MRIDIEPIVYPPQLLFHCGQVMRDLLDHSSKELKIREDGPWTEWAVDSLNVEDLSQLQR